MSIIATRNRNGRSLHAVHPLSCSMAGPRLCRWHAHEEYELHLIVETRGKAFVGDYIGDFKAGDLFYDGPEPAA